MAELVRKTSELPQWLPPWLPDTCAERARRVASGEAASDPTATYAAGCHCGAIALEVTLSPPLEQGYMVNMCNCSACSRLGYLLVYPERSQVRWRGEGDSKEGSSSDRDKCGIYRFNTGRTLHLFCRDCGTSLGVDFQGLFLPGYDGYGLNVRSFQNVDLGSLTYGFNDGKNNVPPAGDVSGQGVKSE
ncbi:hypothetical protein CMQ_4283 [Grosmannia clavigera kw1407]|uniref:CENP-V/GFA domain-containing protein n=1 Tax=Grosmannia clavigera (strain kw1407 / UAMH 11150) TaxID=655863 RepID=F0XTW2_GROCL|nr:uncharacterized protein CMQ_4283 [Grosmannia clavigera kw1407]EFW98431.1 hypothetical protein CMQ_4283 [Grosmannia clavigera kw1407]